MDIWLAWFQENYPRGKLPPALILTLILNQTLTLTGGQFSGHRLVCIQPFIVFLLFCQCIFIKSSSQDRIKNKFRTHIDYNDLDLDLISRIHFLDFGLFINACSKKPFSKTSSHLEIRPLICIANQLTCFYMIQIFTERYFPNRRQYFDICNMF